MPRFVSFRNESGMGKKSGEHLLHLFITGDADKEWLLLRIQKREASILDQTSFL